MSNNMRKLWISNFEQTIMVEFSLLAKLMNRTTQLKGYKFEQQMDYRSIIIV